MNRKSNITIKANNLSKTYTNGNVKTDVIKNLDLNVHQGEFISIMGPSGSGKSTLLYLLGGLEHITEGFIEIKGNTIHTMKDKQISQLRSKTIGFVFQFYNLVPHLSVAENIMLPALLSGSKRKQLVPKMEKLLNTVGLGEKKNAFPSELSGGQQQRVAIARALIGDPEILLADEPIGNLDSKTGKEIMQLFKKINQEQNLTIVQVTHSDKSATYGDRVIYLEDGVITNETTSITQLA